MPPPILDYQSAPTPLARWQHIAAALNRLSWMMLALATAATVVVVFFCPRKPFDPFALLIQELSDIEPLINLAGAAFGVTAAIMGSRWSLAAVLVHIIEACLCPSIGFA